jgi:aminopeptidase N
MARPNALLGLLVLGLAVAVPAASATPAAVPAPVARRAVTFTPGAAGAGDPYFPRAGNGGYDVGHYDLAVRYQPRLGRLHGRATISATATQDLSRFDLDLSGLSVSWVLVDGRAATWSRSGGELVVTPPAGLTRGSEFTTVVRYAGVPKRLPDGSGFVRTRDGAVVAGQPQVAATWFPVNDHPVDKASYTFRVTVPRALQTVANGVLTRRLVRGDWATWTWRATEPMASYLATASIGRFHLHSYRHDGIRLLDAIDPVLFRTAGSAPSYGSVAQASFARQGRIIDFLARCFGPYPFGAAGGVVDDARLGFALENQTRPVYDKGFFTDRFEGDTVVVHELAHQWFGDSLAVRRWRDIFLNEGFAQYAEWMWSEHRGLETAQEIFAESYRGIPARDPFWDVRIGDPGADHLFDEAVYLRGAMTLHELRVTVGDATFFRILRRWAATRAGGNVTVPELVDLAETLSGRPLDDLFQRWLFTSGRPRLVADPSPPAVRLPPGRR